MKSGFVSIIGRPNVGKSTLLNKIVNSKISIVCDKSQTTRNNIKGIYNDNDSQIVFIDTPGIHDAKVKLAKEMNNMALNSLNGADVIVYMVDAEFPFGENDLSVINKINKKYKEIIVVFNKIDKTRIDKITKLKDEYRKIFPNSDFIEMVATENFNINELIKLIKSKLNEGPRYYDVDTITENDEIFLIKEIIREKALKSLSQEVPHCLAVYMENITWETNPINIYASIIVEKDSQKGIVIGANGKRIKEIGTKARQSIEALLKKHVYLELNVKVSEDWRNNDQTLVKLGYKTKKEK